jgi:hypothetical protein
MIECKICKQQFKSMLTTQHLKKHNITVLEYKNQYGSVVTTEYRNLRSKQSKGKNNPNYNKKHSASAKQKISLANQGKTAWNKGVACTNEVKLAISKSNQGKTAWNKGKQVSDETKEKISKARKSQVIKPESITKAIQTKLQKGQDLAFFRGKTHSVESRKKISESSRKYNSYKRKTALDDAAKRIAEVGLEIVRYDQNIATIKCSCNHTFSITRQYLTKSKFKHTLCNRCYPREQTSSKAEREIAEFLSRYTTVITNTRQVISPLELDIYLPNEKIAIEYNGLYWHSEKYKNKQYHREKMQLCNSKEIKLIQIFDDEWINKEEIVKSRLLSYIGKNKKIFARKCEVKQIESAKANRFINETHIQGTGKSQVKLGLYYQTELVAVMTFQKGDISKNQKDWELNRYSSKLNTNIIGGAGKLLKYFVDQYQPNFITTFADLRWSNCSSFYESIGFTFVGYTAINYWYILPNEIKRIHRYALRKPAESTLTETQLRQQQGYLRVYDCGNAKYQWCNLKK